MPCTRPPNGPVCGTPDAYGWTCCGGNVTATEIDLRYKNIPPMNNSLLNGIIERTFDILRKRGLIP